MIEHNQKIAKMKKELKRLKAKKKMYIQKSWYSKARDINAIIEALQYDIACEKKGNDE